MSTALRIASVTQVLKDLLNDGLINHDVTGTTGVNVLVTCLPPDKIDVGINKEASQLNLFMYQATYNQGWKNAYQPSFNSNGERISNPPLAIDLHYLLTAYGGAELHHDILLGYGMQLFHETPALNRDAIRKAIGPPTLIQGGNLPPSLKLLSTSDLAEQVEQIKITPEILSIEDISKLWAAFGTKYRPTAAYKATVVLIESSKSTKSGLPVKARNIYVKTFRQPVIEKILSKSASNQPALENQKILTGYILVLQGYQFTDTNVEVDIDGVDTGASLTVEDNEVSFTLPAGLSAGIHEIQVVHPQLMGSPPVLHGGSMSAAKAFMLSPQIATNPVVANVTGTVLKSATISFTVTPTVNTGQRVTLFLNEMNNNTNPVAYSFPLSSTVVLPTANLSFDISGVKSATYLTRIQVDGAESPLTTDVQGKYNSPFLTIP